jgi:hypothetical protein
MKPSALRFPEVGYDRTVHTKQTMGRTGQQNVPRLEIRVLTSILPNLDMGDVRFIGNTACISSAENRGYDPSPNRISVRHSSEW